MAVTVTDNRTIWNQGDSTTGWGGGSPQLYTSNPYPVELTGSIGVVVSSTTIDSYYTGTSVNLSDALVYVWVLAQGIMDTLQNGGVCIEMGDGTDRIGFHLAGSDKAAFRYDGISVGWQCLLLDTTILPTTYYTQRAGTFAGLNLAGITQIGAMYKTLVKAVGGVENCFTDIIRHGVGRSYNKAGIEITGGTTGDRGTFEQIYLWDRSGADQRAYGIIRSLASGTYGVQGIMSFGTSGTGDTWFQDIGSTVIFEDRFVDDDVYKLRVIGNESVGEETHFILDGVTIQSASPGVLIDWSSPGIDELDIQACSISDITQGILLGENTDSPNHIFTNNVLSNCGLVRAGTVPLRGSTFSNVSNTIPVSATSYYPALLWNPSIDISNCSFINNDNATYSCGILHTGAGTYDYNNLEFSGNSYDIIFLGTGTLTINNIGTSNATTYYAPNGGTVTINQAVTLTLSGIVSGSEVRIQTARGTAPSGAELFHVETTDGTDVEWTFNYSDFGAGYYIDIIIHKSDYVYLAIQNVLLPSSNTTLPIQQQFDRWYSNP